MSATSIILLVIALVVILVVVAAWLYERASREVSLVRTGLGGRKVVLDGGVIVLPSLYRRPSIVLLVQDVKKENYKRLPNRRKGKR